MPSELLSSISGSGSGEFIAKFASGALGVGAGATGTYITLTPPSGQRVKLTLLHAGANQTNLTTVTVGGNNVVTGLSLRIGSTGATIGYKVGGDIPIDDSIVGDINEVLAISTDVATSSTTYYAYQFGV